jgi:imidazolonepropionase-like amidohydrolase
MFLLMAASPAEKPLAIKTDRVVTVTGGVIENGVILIEKGKIVKIAPRLELPLDARVIEAETLTAYPGMVLAGTSVSVDSSAGGSEEASVADSFWPFGRTYDRIRANGVTALGLAPRRGGFIAGQGVVVRPLSRKKQEIVLGKSEFLVMDFSASYARRLEAFLKQTESSRRAGPPGRETRAGPAVGARVAAGELPAVIRVRDATSVLRIVEILAPHRAMRKSFVPGGDVVNALPALIKAKVPCVLPAEHDFKPGSSYEVNVAASLAAAKVPVCLLPRSDSTAALETFRFDVARLIRSGLAPEDALKAVTIVPAQVLGIDWRTGSLEEGKDADILLLDGDLFDPQAKIRNIFIAGEKVVPEEAAP